VLYDEFINLCETTLYVNYRINCVLYTVIVIVTSTCYVIFFDYKFSSRIRGSQRPERDRHGVLIGT